DFAGSQADKDLVRRKAMERRDFLAQAQRATVRVAMRFGESTARGVDRQRRRAERVFVGSKFNGANLELALDVFDGATGNVNRKAANVIGDKGFDGVRH